MHKSIFALLFVPLAFGGLITTQPISFTSEFGDTITMSTSELTPGQPFDVLINISAANNATPRMFNLAESAQIILDDGTPTGDSLYWYFFLHAPVNGGWRTTLAVSDRWTTVNGEIVKVAGPSVITTGTLGGTAQVSGQFVLDNSPTPEPATWLLIALPLTLAGMFRRKLRGSTTPQ